MKKGQVTIFIILGIIIVITFLIIFSFSQTYTREQRQITRQVKTQLESSAVNLYITSCLENSFEEAILLIAENGGWIYNVSGCNTNNCTSAGSIGNSSYGLTMHPETEGTPKYPCIDASQEMPYCRFYYNASPEPTLALLGKLGLPQLDTGQNSIKDQIEKYIEMKVLKCINFSAVQNITAQPYRVDIQEPNVTVNVRPEDVRATLNLPVSIDFRSRTVTEQQEYTLEKKIRLRMIYNFLYELLYNDNTDLGFDASTDFSNLIRYAGGMRLNISFNRKAFDDLIVLTDNQSIINNKPVKFKIARQNLPPVLNYLSGVSTPDYDYILFDNQTLVIDPEIFDPNEDDLSVSFAKWKFHYDEIYVPGVGVQRINLTTTPAREGNKITMPLSENDLGPHELTVSVTDGQYIDYQVLRILVDDPVKLEIINSNPYPNISNDFASIEDPYHFEAATVDVYNPGNYTFQWHDSAEQKILYEGDRESFWIPGIDSNSVLYYDGVNIDDISGPFNVYPVSHPIRAVVRSTAGELVNEDSKSVNILVRQCLPHRSDIPPYPYNGIQNNYDNYTEVSTDPFMGSHTCCIGDSHATWHIADENTVCYEQTQYGSSIVLGISSPYPDGGDINDVYLKKFERKCDGVRGNMCMGPESESLLLYESCGNANAPNYCQGPQLTNAISKTPLGCMNYTGLSFTGKPCNEEWKCTSLESYLVFGNYLCQGGCNGPEGCALPLSCQDPNDEHMKCIRQSNEYITKSCTCVSKSGDDEIECSVLDLDDSQNLCNICIPYTAWVDGNCCGDDSGEFFNGTSCVMQ
jgi:hypothetical protein